MSKLAPGYDMPRTNLTAQHPDHFRLEKIWPELVRSSMAGDRKAAETLFAWIRPRIVRYCRSRISGSGAASASAEGGAQEICLAAVSALARYADAPEAFLP